MLLSGLRAARRPMAGALMRVQMQRSMYASGKVAGAVELIIGPMFAGKTTELLKRCEERRQSGQRILLVKSDKDKRYSESEVVSHDRLKHPCYSLKELRPLLDKDLASQFDVAAIDEAQFFPDLLDFCCAWADALERTVIVAGLDADCERRKFGQVLDLVPHAESVSKLTARCGVCGQPASFTKRTVPAKGQVLVGGADMYTAVCRQHLNTPSMAVEGPSLYVENQEIIRGSAVQVCIK